MKKFLLLATLLFGCGLAMSAQNTKMAIDKEVYDFGTIKEAKGKVSTIFTVSNKGMYPLIITRVIASCGCTTPEWTKEPIASGKTGKITVTYDPANRPGSFLKNITIYANTDDGYARVMIKGSVE